MSLDEPTRDLLTKLSEAQRRSRSAIVRQAVEFYAQKEGTT